MGRTLVVAGSRVARDPDRAARPRVVSTAKARPIKRTVEEMTQNSILTHAGSFAEAGSRGAAREITKEAVTGSVLDSLHFMKRPSFGNLLTRI
jgi:hypothetical protein